jgi:hypothetical protein
LSINCLQGYCVSHLIKRYILQIHITNKQKHTLSNGQSLIVTTISFGQEQPAGTGVSFGNDPLFYDAQVLPTGSTTLGQDFEVSLSISNPAFIDGVLIYYWSGANWLPASKQVYDTATHTISGIIPASDLLGTPVTVTG